MDPKERTVALMKRFCISMDCEDITCKECPIEFDNPLKVDAMANLIPVDPLEATKKWMKDQCGSNYDCPEESNCSVCPFDFDDEDKVKLMKPIYELCQRGLDS